MVLFVVSVSVGCVVIFDDDVVVVATESFVVIVVAKLPFIQQNHNVHINFEESIFFPSHPPPPVCSGPHI